MVEPQEALGGSHHVAPMRGRKELRVVNQLERYRLANSLTIEELTARLNGAGHRTKNGEALSTRYVGMICTQKTRRPPQAWAETFRLPDEPPPDRSPGAAPPPGAEPLAPGADLPTGGGESPPRPLPGTNVILEPSMAQVAQERIAGFYGLIGGAIGTASGQPEITEVTDAVAPDIARAWIRAAEENDLARRVVRFATMGGSSGELVFAHAFWIGGLLYVTGRIPNLGGLFGRFDQARASADERRPPVGNEGDGGGQPEADPAGVVVGSSTEA